MSDYTVWRRRKYFTYFVVSNKDPDCDLQHSAALIAALQEIIILSILESDADIRSRWEAMETLLLRCFSISSHWAGVSNIKLLGSEYFMTSYSADGHRINASEVLHICCSMFSLIMNVMEAVSVDIVIRMLYCRVVVSPLHLLSQSKSKVRVKSPSPLESILLCQEPCPSQIQLLTWRTG